MNIAVYPGSFDPITFGHLDIIERASLVYDKVIVAVSVNSGKVPLFSSEERVKMITRECLHIPNVEATSFQGLLSDFVKHRCAHVIVRGLRAISDFEYEFQMALMNRKLNPTVETVFLVAKPEFSFLSSSIVKEIVDLGGDAKGFVSEEVAKQLRERLINRK